MTSSSIRGMAQTKAALAAAMAKVTAATPAAEHAGAEIVAASMAAHAPVDTGRLRLSIHAEGSSAVADTPYALYVTPFAAAAAQAVEGEVVAAQIAVLRAALGGR